MPQQAKISSLILIFVCSLVFLFFAANRTINVHDEGIVLTGALRVLHGDIPHRDFYTNYGPAQFYILAFLFKLFGPLGFVERLYDMCLRAMILALCYGALSFYCRQAIAIITTIICAVWLSYMYPGYASTPVLLFGMVSSLFVFAALSAQRNRYLLAAGVATAIASFYRYDAGPLLVLANTGTLLTLIGLNGQSLAEKIKTVVTMLCWYAAGVLFTALPVFAVYLPAATIDGWYRDVVAYSKDMYPLMRALPFPSFIVCIIAGIYIPPLVIAAVIATTIKNPLLLQVYQRPFAFTVAFGFLSAALYNQAIVRTDMVHMLPAIIPALLVLAVLVEYRRLQPFILEKYLQLLLALAFVPTILFLFYCLNIAVAQWPFIWGMEPVAAQSSQPPCKPIEPPSIAYLLTDQDRLRAICFLATHTKPEEPIYVGLTRHDKIAASDVFVYFAVGRVPPTKWHQLDPGLQTRADIQAEMVQDLTSHNVRTLLLNSEFDDVEEPNASAVSSGVTLLDDYIRQHYKPVETFGTLSVWARTRK